MSRAPRPVTPLAILADTLDRLSARVATLDGVDEELRSDVRRAAERIAPCRSD